MSAPLKYETPENVQIEYHPAGLGTRFIAWFVDQIIITVLIFLAIIALVIYAAIFDGAFRQFFRWVDETVGDGNQKTSPETAVMYFVGIGTLIWGLGSLFYFGLSELMWRGQTLGKKLCHIRVVKLDGFALDGVSIFVRNIFRVADNLPLLWVVPFLSKRGQRTGDMVGGTIVVSEEAEQLPEVREQLSRRNPAEARFRFEQAKLGRLTRDDFESIERILDRWSALTMEQKTTLLNRIVGPLCKKMQADEPPSEQRVEFLEDLLAAEYRRQDRQLR